MAIHRHMSPEERFWVRVEKTDSCWLWTGMPDSYGYGRLKINNKSQGAHVFSYRLHKGEIPDGLFVCHHCDNPPCVNPDHLFLGTAQDNNQDRTIKGRSASGLKSGHYTKPERTIRGKAHYNYGNPNAPQKGTGNGRAILNEEKVREIRARWNNGHRNKSELGRIYGVTNVLIGKIIRRELWSHVD